MTRLARLEEDVKAYDGLAAVHEEAVIYYGMAREEGDESAFTEGLAALEKVETSLDQLEVRTLLSGDYDEYDAICSLNAGEGGTESCDWAAMLQRMYIRWAERHSFEVEVLDVQPGEEAGIKQTTFVVKGRFAYGFMSTEAGVHRLVRISPFDSSSRRHTSFASLDVIPFIEELEDIEIDPKDLRVETYRSSGAGGQHVNVTDSAVRLTHEPSGIVVAVQNERSQLQNKAVAMRILGAKLAEIQRKEREKELQDLRGEQKDIGFGSQIRSYVLHPYQMIKDKRTDVEVGNVEAILEGDLDVFINAELRRRASEK